LSEVEAVRAVREARPDHVIRKPSREGPEIPDLFVSCETPQP
jgi:hypothetical protein